jgi:osomolarity two-component system sensor histidine kinase NIK1
MQDNEKVPKLEKEMYDMDSSTSKESTPQMDQKLTRNTRNNMTNLLDGLKSSIDPSQMFTHAYGNMKAHWPSIAQVHAINSGGGSYNSALPTALSQCPTCRKLTSDPLIFYNTMSLDDGAPLSSRDPLTAAAFESRMSAVEAPQSSGTGCGEHV